MDTQLIRERDTARAALEEAQANATRYFDDWNASVRDADNEHANVENLSAKLLEAQAKITAATKALKVNHSIQFNANCKACEALAILEGGK